MMVSPRLLQDFDAQIRIKIMSKWILNAPLFLLTMTERMVNLVAKVGIPLKRLPQTSKKVLGLHYGMHS